MLFKKQTPEEGIEGENKQMLVKNYDLLPNQKDYPTMAHLLQPNKLQATSYSEIGNNIHIDIGHKIYFSCSLKDNIRVSYDRVYKGTLICSEINKSNEQQYSSVSIIKHSLFSNYKELIVPILNKCNLYVKCKRIYIDNFDIYAFYESKLILESDYREIIIEQFEKDYRT